MLTVSRLHQVLEYRPDTGDFVWRLSMSNRAPVGSVAGSVGPQGYRQIRVDGVLYQAHRLAWLFVTEQWPPVFIDHRDLNRSNNRFANLRLATEQQNSENGPMRRHNSVGLKGVGLHKPTGKYRARIRVANREHHLGLFDTPEDAHAAYCAASERLHGAYGRKD